MTVTYSSEIATSTSLTLLKLLFRRWRGSVLRLLWRDLLFFILLYYILQISYLFHILNDQQREIFRVIVNKSKTYLKEIRLEFLLGFFIANVMSRWWIQYESIPWPYSIAVYVSTTIHGFDEVSRALRRTIMRYVCLSLTMVFRVLSPRVKKRFPKMGDLVDAGLLNENELSIIEVLEKKYPGLSKNWLPICWAAALACRARKDGRIKDDLALKTIIEELNAFRGKCGVLMNYATICIPLVYVQVVIIATYSYFALELFSNQVTDGHNEHSLIEFLDYLPIHGCLQFIFYMGWLKVAETMINPFGEDDDDFEVNNMIDRNLQMSYLIVDEMHQDHPELLKDQYWDEIPIKLPDRVKDLAKEVEKPVTDVFDVAPDEGLQLRQRKATFINSPDADFVSLSIAESKADLKPRSSVIDNTYRNISNVEMSQNLLERQMQKTREKAIGLRLSDSSSDSEVGVNVTFSENSSIGKSKPS